MGAPLDISAYPPDGMEIRLIERFTTLRGQRILEVGCGDGRLTFQYAQAAGQVLPARGAPFDVALFSWSL